ncbi:MAG: ribonuclease HII [Anaerolineales bacterium]
MRPSLEIEKSLWRGGFARIAGLDEAGRGALAGPVAVGVVILPPNTAHLAATLSGVRDSKQLTPRQREHWAKHIRQVALDWSVGFASAGEIDRWGIVAAVRMAALRALSALNFAPDYLVTDFQLHLPTTDLPQTSLVEGDVSSLTIAAASILAKTVRDAYMREMDRLYPAYGFAQHKGYATLQHRHALRSLGFSPLHRRTFLGGLSLDTSQKSG